MKYLALITTLVAMMAGCGSHSYNMNAKSKAKVNIVGLWRGAPIFTVDHGQRAEFVIYLLGDIPPEANAIILVNQFQEAVAGSKLGWHDIELTHPMRSYKITWHATKSTWWDYKTRLEGYDPYNPNGFNRNRPLVDASQTGREYVWDGWIRLEARVVTAELTNNQLRVSKIHAKKTIRVQFQCMSCTNPQ